MYDHIPASQHAELRDHIAEFQAEVVDAIEVATGTKTTWDELARKLQREDKDPAKHGQQATEAVKQALNRLGFTWEDWVNLRKISSAGVASFHQGSRGYASALNALEEVPLPKDVEPAAACKDSVAKVIKFLWGQGAS